jgi:hypothetical protein
MRGEPDRISTEDFDLVDDDNCRHISVFVGSPDIVDDNRLSSYLGELRCFVDRFVFVPMFFNRVCRLVVVNCETCFACPKRQTPELAVRVFVCALNALAEYPGPKDLLVNHRTSWGILPQTPVFSLRSRAVT